MRILSKSCVMRALERVEVRLSVVMVGWFIHSLERRRKSLNWFAQSICRLFDSWLNNFPGTNGVPHQVGWTFDMVSGPVSDVL